MQDVLADEYFIRQLDHFHLSGLGKNNNIVQVGTIGDKLILFQTGPNKSFRPVDV